MPLSGRHGAGANVWVEDGSIWLYLGHNGAYDEEGRLLKLGCVRITPVGLALGEGVTNAAPLQELDPATGTVTVRQGGFRSSLWFADETLIIETDSGKPRALEVSFATWRDQRRDGVRLDMHSTASVSPDVVKADSRAMVWFHRNAAFPVDVAGIARSQGITPDAVCDATSRRVSGGALVVEGQTTPPVESNVHWQNWAGKAWTGRTPLRSRHVLAVRLGAGNDADPSRWAEEAHAILQPSVVAAARAGERKRWAEFWERSHVVINSKRGVDATDPGFLIGRNYQLFRYMLACNRDGELPLLFNGGIFTTDNEPGRIKGNNNDELPISQDGPSTPDFRRWMGCRFMSQNQRWLGWPTLAGGDADLLAPSLAFYRDRHAVAMARARRNGADGAVYPEPLDIWGLCCVAPRPDGLCGAEHLTYHFSMMLEHAWMALQARGNLGIPLKEHLPWIEDVVVFYDSYYRAQTRTRTGRELGENGKLVIYPACGLEFAGGATDPIEVVCALKRLTAGLQALPELSSASRERMKRIESVLPDIPVGSRDGRASLLPARTFERGYNKWEPIEMYAYWPYRFVGATQPGTLQLARDTWATVPEDRARLCKQDYSWMANVVNMAALAWPEEARKRAVYKMANIAAPQARFPAFFGPGHDWLPDHNWGGSGMTGIQEMLLAPQPGAHGKLYLFPGWPRDWDVDFKLHAPGSTTVEARLAKGRLVSLKVAPESRSRDIVNLIEHPGGTR